MNEPTQNAQDGIAGLTGSPKTMFYLGLSSGIGIMAILGLVFVMTSFMNGGIPGAFAKADTKAPTNPAIADTTGEEPTAQPPAAPVPDVTDADHVLGSANAKVTLIEYSDFECPFCSRHVDVIEQLLADYPNDIRVVFRHFPLSFHPSAQKAAEASECASAQGKFWEMHDKLFELSAGTGLNIDAMKKAAADIGLNTNDFNSCLDSGEMASEVANDYQGGISAGVGGTPGTFVNGQLVEGALPIENFKQIVESEGASN